MRQSAYKLLECSRQKNYCEDYGILADWNEIKTDFYQPRVCSSIKLGKFGKIIFGSFIFFGGKKC